VGFQPAPFGPRPITAQNPQIYPAESTTYPPKPTKPHTPNIDHEDGDLMNLNEHVNHSTSEYIRHLAFFGFSDEDIATTLGIQSEKELTTHFGHDLEKSPIAANLEVAKSLFDLATVGKNVTAATFWLRCRAGWNVKPGNAAYEGDFVINCDAGGEL
jgi:AraC-like DNA-binding protein